MSNTNTKADEFIKDICRTVGHEWQMRMCSRCGGTQPLAVYVNGVLQLPGEDYVEYTTGSETLVTFTNQTGDKAQMTITYAGVASSECRVMYYINAGESVSLNLPV